MGDCDSGRSRLRAGILIVWSLDPDDPNPFVVIIGTIFVGGLCLLLLQPIMLLASALFGQALEAVNVIASISVTVPLGWQLAKHILENRAEAALEKVVRRKTA